jgi:lipopolysaccharide/colanic/teichoic acid biosynthesis glycosyltransferase
MAPDARRIDVKLMDKARAYGRVVRNTHLDEMPDLFRLLRRRPLILAGVSAYETGLMASNRVDGRVKALATIKASSLVGCPF